ncbi:hypothetical protein [uncultured Tyzzerella sp.]|uniref:hypothetical protein n=1 Tax=uncultured Tyzzerella sp. TaxID=2321398 RepID=UPI0029426A79|nr:hypothetical protein [uncultured Tyzzerella sp.]
MKRKNLKNCPSFKAITSTDARHNKPLTTNCSHCVYFSSKNCHFEASNDIEPDIDFI